MLQQETTTILAGTVQPRAVVYARVSGDDSKQDGRNLRGQLEMGREYAQQKGYDVVAELAEDEKAFTSGADMDLPQLNRIREMAASGQFDILVVRELDRLSRNLAKQIILEQELLKAGVRIEYVIGQYADTPEGQLSKNIKAVIADYERQKIKERVVRGKINKAKSGQVPKGKFKPFGYDYDDERKTLKINDLEAGIVRSIFTMCLEGKGTNAIATELTRLGVLTSTGKSKWGASSVYHLLTNPVYTGIWEYGKVTQNKRYNAEKGRDEAHWVKNPADKRVTVQIPAIIDTAIFEGAKAKLASNFSNSKRNTKYEYLMSGRLRCQCGAKMAVRDKVTEAGHWAYYMCNRRRRPGKYGDTCDMPTFTTKEVDDKVWGTLEYYLEHPDQLRDGLLKYQNETDQTTKPLRDRLTIIEDSLTHWGKEFENAAQNLRAAKGAMAKAVFGEELDRIENTLEGLQRERAETISRIEQSSLSEAQIDSTVEFARKIRENLEAIGQDFDSKREFIDLLDIRLVLFLADGQRKGLFEGFIGAKEEVCFNSSMTNLTGRPKSITRLSPKFCTIGGTG
jgi:site-specific DNA recombinase